VQLGDKRAEGCGEGDELPFERVGNLGRLFFQTVGGARLGKGSEGLFEVVDDEDQAQDRFGLMKCVADFARNCRLVGWRGAGATGGLG
jgi:hypothetical protein